MNVILSIKPVYAHRILNGVKRFEFRKVPMRHVKPGDIIYLYASSPTQKIVGKCEIKNIVTGRPEEVWDVARLGAGMGISDFQMYFRRAKFGCAYELTNPVKYCKPIKPQDMCVNTWTAPQSYRYAKTVDIDGKEMFELCSPYTNDKEDVSEDTKPTDVAEEVTPESVSESKESDKDVSQQLAENPRTEFDEITTSFVPHIYSVGDDTRIELKFDFKEVKDSIDTTITTEWARRILLPEVIHPIALQRPFLYNTLIGKIFDILRTLRTITVSHKPIAVKIGFTENGDYRFSVQNITLDECWLILSRDINFYITEMKEVLEKKAKSDAS